jgi:hypothetical protein
MQPVVPLYSLACSLKEGWQIGLLFARPPSKELEHEIVLLLHFDYQLVWSISLVYENQPHPLLYLFVCSLAGFMVEVQGVPLNTYIFHCLSK